MFPSGAAWCAQFPGSSSLEDLAEPFRTGAKAFIEAVRDAGASVAISATYRPPERAWLMHWCCWVAGFRDGEQAFRQVVPSEVPARTGIDIDWTHGDYIGAARAASVAMREGYGIVFPAALESRHTERLAIDMTIQFKGAISVRAAGGAYHQVACLSDLYPIGASYNVFKLASDPPHWSSDGR